MSHICSNIFTHLGRFKKFTIQLHVQKNIIALLTRKPFPYLVVLVRSNSNEISLGENVGSERAVGKLQNVVGSNNVKSWLVFVHGVQNGLK